MNNEEYLKSIRKKKLYRLMAWIGLIIIFVSVVATIVTAVTGSKYFIAALASCFVLSLLVYAMLFIGKVLFSVGEDIAEKQAEDESENEIDTLSEQSDDDEVEQ